MTAGVEARPIADPPVLADDSAGARPAPSSSVGRDPPAALAGPGHVPGRGGALWRLLTANDVRLWLRFDQLPDPVEVVRRVPAPALGPAVLPGPGAEPGADPHRLRPRRGRGRRPRHRARRGRAWLADVRSSRSWRSCARSRRSRWCRSRSCCSPPTSRGSSSSPSSRRSSRSWSAPGTPCGRCRRCGRTRCGPSAAAGGGCSARSCCRASCPASSAGCRSAWASRGSASSPPR